MYSKDFLKEIKENGAENIIFLVPMRPVRTYFGLISLTSSNDAEVIVPCKINQERYKIDKNYKITLESIYDGFGKQHFYVSDLIHLIKLDTIQYFIKRQYNEK